MALGIVKQICTPSSAARPPVNHPKGSLPPLSTRFLISPPFISSLFFFIFLLLFYLFFFFSFRSTIVFARLFRVRKPVLRFPPRNAMEFGAGCGSSTHASLKKLKEATLSLPAGRAIVPFDTTEEGGRTQQTLVITSIRSTVREDVESFILIWCH